MISFVLPHFDLKNPQWDILKKGFLPRGRKALFAPRAGGVPPQVCYFNPRLRLGLKTGPSGEQPRFAALGAKIASIPYIEPWCLRNG